ncbi:usg protein [Sneathiella sp. HT1-7]|uniref:usg protein n=1 Tax=Sneathiella sp. HT1-7 TaxID=2887192 RepID=UPI001D133D82|nr:usg protein [Sneathiella sp. HT1-7]MCC3306526.1 usg protein [Sneathiella sp. HT1-7]
MSEMEKMLQGYVLTTAEILYHLPDYPEFLQTYIWQEYDLAPKYPTLKKFLDFWEAELDGPLHSVRVASKKLISPSELKYSGTEYLIN